MTLDTAKDLLMNNSRYFATMMVKEKDADGFVSGACHATSDTLRPALQILKTAPGTKLVSAFLLWYFQIKNLEKMVCSFLQIVV